MAMNIAATFDLRGTRDDIRHEVRYALRGCGRRSHDVAEAIVKRAGRAAGYAASTSLKSTRVCCDAAPTAVARGCASRAYRRSRCASSARNPISPTITYHRHAKGHNDTTSAAHDQRRPGGLVRDHVHALRRSRITMI